MNLVRLCVVCFATVVVSVLTGPGVSTCAAQGVSVAPLRVLFEGRTRSATVFLSNRTTETSTYRISLVNRRMLDTGAIVEATEAWENELFADDLIRFSPRRVTIEPFGSQTIRLLARRPRGDAPENAEYRTHLSIRAIPAAPRLEDLEQKDQDIAEGRISVTAVATVETIMPIIMRIGDPQARIEIANPRLELTSEKSNYPQLTVDLLRTGERSVYGEMYVTHVANDGQRTQLFFARGLAVYYPALLRAKIIPLKTATPQLLQSGQLIVTYDETEDMNGDQSAQLLINLNRETAQVQ